MESQAKAEPVRRNERRAVDGAKVSIFINILCVPFLHESALRSFSLFLQICFVIFWHKNIGAKANRKMLMKLTTEWQQSRSRVIEKQQEVHRVTLRRGLLRERRSGRENRVRLLW